MEKNQEWTYGLPKETERREKYYIIDSENYLVAREVRYGEDETGEAEVAIWHRDKRIGPADDLPQWFIDELN